MMPSRLHSPTISRPSVDSPPSFFLSNELTPALLVLFQQMPKKRTPAPASFCEHAGIVLDGERAFDAEKQRDLAGGLGGAQLGGGARARELGVLLEQPFELLELPPEAAPRHQAHAGEEQAAERVDAALVQLGHVDVEGERVVERLRAVTAPRSPPRKHQLGQHVVVQVDDERLAVKTRNFVLDGDGRSVHRGGVIAVNWRRDL